MAIIRRVQRIKSFGVYADFRWTPELPVFNRYNLLYGWNYSGKTTLSRVFRCFELKQPHPDFMGAEIKLETEDGKTHESPTYGDGLTLRVFNGDFIRENLSFDDGSTNPILILGQEDIHKQRDLERKKLERERRQTALERKREEVKAIADALEAAKTTRARDIKKTLFLPDYDKTRFGQQINVVSRDVEKYMLSDAEFRRAMTTSLSSDKKPFLARKTFLPTTPFILAGKAKHLLERIVTAKTIMRLADNPEIEEWVKSGRSLHKDSDICEFCGSVLPSDLLNKLAGHFSADYEDLMNDLTLFIQEVEQAASEYLALEDEARFYPEFSLKYASLKTRLEDLLLQRKKTLETLIESLRDKQVKAFSKVQCPLVEDVSDKIRDVIASINLLIDDHNRRTEEFGQLKEAAISLLEKHYAAQFVSEQDFDMKLRSISDLESTIATATADLNGLSGEIVELELEVGRAAKGAEQINFYLRGYFGKEDLQLTATPDKRFHIIRQGIAAKNLSEGEKTAIAFAYFIARLAEKGTDISKTIVVIDDPISSLDANHLFNTVALIRTTLGDCHQLFMSTHNFEFFNLLRDWLSDLEKPSKTLPHKDLKKWRAFLIERYSISQSVIREIPRELILFKSEYHYLFSILHQFTSLTEVDFAQLFNLPNITRRYMEAFGGIMIPSHAGLQKKMEKLFPNAVERERVWKFINHYSHNTSVTRSLTVPDTSECKAVLACCLEAVKQWNKEHYDALVEAIT